MKETYPHLKRRSNGYFYIFTARGISKSLGTKDRLKAHELFYRMAQEIRDGELEKSQPLKLEKAIKDYLESRAFTNTNKTFCADRLHLKNLLNFARQQQVIHIEKIDRKFMFDFRTYVAKLYPNSDNSKRTCMAHVRGFFSKMVDQEIINRDPCYKIKSFNPGDPEIVVMTKREADYFMTVADKYPKVKIPIALMRYTLMPRENVVKPFAIQDGNIIYRRGKKKREIIVPISSMLSPYIGHLADGIHRVFPHKERYFSKLFAEVAKEAGMPWVTPHKMRHTGATILLNQGEPIEKVSRLLGHRDIAITLKHYAKFVIDVLKTAVEKL